jgi:hypothetical protein
MMEAHTKKGHITSEGAHLESAQAIRAVYEELFKVAEKLGDPIPVWF